jgi:pimeloyl-ACP methyl ester carboxylesterase
VVPSGGPVGGDQLGGNVEISEFRIDVDTAVIEDLRQRAARARLADEPEDAGWDYGTNAAYLKELVAYWADGFDWYAQQAQLNQVPQFRAEVQGVRIHFAHQRGTGPDPLPLLLVHGWPSGYLEMTKLIPLLADPGAHGGDPSDAFDVIVPSLPGFGFSGAPARRGFGYYRAGLALHDLLFDGLGYERYGVHGTGLGAYVNGWMAFEHPECVVGCHTHDPALMPRASFEPPAAPPSDAELAFGEISRQWAAAEGAYAELHRTKPQSIGHALNDSPAGLASWLVEKHRTWSDCHGDLERRYTKDELLTSATTYWVTGTIASSMRAYHERVNADPSMEPGRRLPVPTGVAMPRFEPTFPPRRAPREMIDRVHDVRHWVDLPSGGHFASWEEPALVADSIRTFFRPLR